VLSSLVSGELLERADLALRDGEFLATLVESKVGRYVVLLKRFLSFPGFPEIARHLGDGGKDVRAGGSSAGTEDRVEKAGPNRRTVRIRL
jgi:hypothetical protein